jgi:hypothetical protein
MMKPDRSTTDEMWRDFVAAAPPWLGVVTIDAMIVMAMR